MPRGQIHINLLPEHPIMSFETMEIKMATISAKWSTRRENYYDNVDDDDDDDDGDLSLFNRFKRFFLNWKK